MSKCRPPYMTMVVTALTIIWAVIFLYAVPPPAVSFVVTVVFLVAYIRGHVDGERLEQCAAGIARADYCDPLGVCDEELPLELPVTTEQARNRLVELAADALCLDSSGRYDDLLSIISLRGQSAFTVSFCDAESDDDVPEYRYLVTVEEYPYEVTASEESVSAAD